MYLRLFILILLGQFGLALAMQEGDPKAARMQGKAREEMQETSKVVKSEEEWRRLLTPEQFHIMRQKGTEPPFTGKYHNHKGKGVYTCAGCGLELFSSETKFDSGTGWPSFYKPVGERRIHSGARE